MSSVVWVSETVLRWTFNAQVDITTPGGPDTTLAAEALDGSQQFPSSVSTAGPNEVSCTYPQPIYNQHHGWLISTPQSNVVAHAGTIYVPQSGIVTGAPTAVTLITLDRTASILGTCTWSEDVTSVLGDDSNFQVQRDSDLQYQSIHTNLDGIPGPLLNVSWTDASATGRLWRITATPAHITAASGHPIGWPQAGATI